MKILGYTLLAIAAVFFLLGIRQFSNAAEPSLATVIGTFAIPGLLAWWGAIALKRAKLKEAAKGQPTPESHVRCPDCRELVLKEARVCKHCQAKLVPIEG